MHGSVTLIIPPSPFLLDERVFPSLGITKVASSLIAKGYDVDLLDLSGIQNYVDVIREYAERVDHGTFGLTATTPQFPAAVSIAKALREVTPHSKRIIGGTHATLTVAALRLEKKDGRVARAHRAYEQLEAHFDVIVAGDGEESVVLALDDHAPKLIDVDDRKSEYFLTNKTFDESPFPARHLLDMESYHYSIDGARATSVIAQLGCPYRCGFCAGRLSPMLRNIRMRSDDNIIEELRALYLEYGYTGFMFYDDELNVNTGVVGLMEKIARVQRDLNTSWNLRGFVKSERFTDEQAEAMREAGFKQLLIGFESGSPRILKNIEKIATRENNSRCMDIARRHDIKIKALMSFGHPGESRETIAETKTWLLEEKPFDFDATIITPYPGSPYFDNAVCLDSDSSGRDVWTYRSRNGDALYQLEVDYTSEADYYKGNPDDGYISHVWTDFISRGDLVRARDRFERDVRKALDIPFNPSSPAVLYEHSMGQTSLSPHILRRSKPLS